jgi:acyl-CoA synthetase (AMP-forming)/AMP-acid ligase II
MYFKSLFPDPPKVLESNVHHLFFDRPEQKDWPDYTLFVDVATGQRRSFREFVERVRDGATALGTDVAQGGLGLCPGNGEVVGILSEDCLVRRIPHCPVERLNKWDDFQDYIALVHSLLVITVPFALFSSYSTTYEFKHTSSLVQPTRIFARPSLLPVALTSGLPADRIYLLEGENKGHISYDQLVSSVRTNGIPRLPVRHATKDTLAYMVFSSGTSGLPKGMCYCSFSCLPSVLHGKHERVSAQYFSLYETVVMLSQGNITHAVLGTMLFGAEISKVRAVCLFVATYILRLPDPFASHRSGTPLRAVKYSSVSPQFTILLASM